VERLQAGIIALKLHAEVQLLEAKDLQMESLEQLQLTPSHPVRCHCRRRLAPNRTGRFA
jgi:hypothetical protein